VSRGELVLLPHALRSNLYLRELGAAYGRLGLGVVYGADNLVELGFSPRYVHLHWPEEHYRWSHRGPPAERATRFLAQLDRLKSAGSRLIWTAHNLAPHDHPGDPLDRHVYQAVIARADVILHHCASSARALAARYRVPEEARIVVVPHGHFLAYPSTTTRERARRELGIAEDAFVYLHFGQVRAYKGITTLIEAFSGLDVPKKHLLVAGHYIAFRAGSALVERLRLLRLRHATPHVTTALREVPEDEVQTFMAASDVLVLSHAAGLNSGVAVLGMSFGKVVIGPDLGCIAEALREGENLLYPASDVKALRHAMRASTTMDRDAAGARNLRAARGWDWDTMARAIIGAAGAADAAGATPG